MISLLDNKDVLKDIIEFKPDGSTHVDSIGLNSSCRYLKIENGLVLSVSGIIGLKPCQDLNSIKSIETILNLMEKI